MSLAVAAVVLALPLTLSVGSDVRRMSTAHSMRVLGGFSVGTTGSGGASSRFSLADDSERCERSGGGGGGSANSGCTSVAAIRGGSISCSPNLQKPAVARPVANLYQRLEPEPTPHLLVVQSHRDGRQQNMCMPADPSRCAQCADQSHICGWTLVSRTQWTQGAHRPVPRTHENKARLAFLNLSVRYVCAQVRALRLHSVQLFCYILSLYWRKFFLRAEIELIRYCRLRRSQAKKNEGVVAALL